MNRSITIALPKARWPHLQKMFHHTIGYKLQDGIKLSSDGGKSWTHNGVHTNMEDHERAVLEKSKGSVLGVNGRVEVDAKESTELRKTEHRSIRSILWRKRHGGRAHFDELIAAKGLVLWDDPKAPQP